MLILTNMRNRSKKVQSSVVVNVAISISLSSNNHELILKAPDCCAHLFDRERFLITDKQREILGCIPCVMVISLSTGQAEPIYRPLCAMHIV